MTPHVSPSVAPIPMSVSLVRYAGLRNTGLSLPSPGLNPRARQAHRRLVARIRELADAAGFPVTHLPDRAGVSRSHFWDVMGLRRSPTVVWLHSVAEALDVELSALFPPEE